MLLEEKLPATPPSVSRARRLVAEMLHGSSSEARLDEILLLLSEIMTNAVLHAGTEIVLRVVANEHSVRVEVIDGSAVLPTQPDYAPDASTGRGLGLVALVADDHGVDCLGEGKAVWFRVGDPADEGALTTGWSTDLDATDSAAQEISLLGVPVHLFRAMQQHDDALLREHALIRLAGGSYQPPQLPVNLRSVEAALREAAEAGVDTVDVSLTAPAAAAEGARVLLDVLARADQQAFAGELLTPAALPEVRWCRRWHLGEIAGQLLGAPAKRWAPLDVQQQQPVARVDARHVLDALPHAVIAGDGQNRVVYLNATATALLGWSAEDLVGKGITALIPERLRDRHLAAFTSYLVTGSAGLVERPLRICALRRDGQEIDVDVVLSAERTPQGQPLFVAMVRPVVDRVVAEAERLDLRE